MARTAQYDEGELKAALQMVTEATTIQELRQGQAVLLPALTWASLDTTAEVLGLTRDRVCSPAAVWRIAQETLKIQGRTERGGAPPTNEHHKVSRLLLLACA